MLNLNLLSWHILIVNKCRLSLLGVINPADDNLHLWLRWPKDLGPVTHIPSATAGVQISDSNLDYHIRSMRDYVTFHCPLKRVINQYGIPKDAQSAQNVMRAILNCTKVVVNHFTELETAVFVKLGSRPMRLPRPVQRDATFIDAYPKSPILIYTNMHHAAFHMAIYVTRVSCMTHLMALASQVGFETGIEKLPEYQALLHRAQDDLEAIVSSVPFICGWTADGTHIFPNALDATLRHPQSQGTCFATNFITWSLVGQARNPIATEEQRQYLIHMARYLADIRRVRQAEVLLDVTAQGTTKLSLSRWHQRVEGGDTSHF